MFEWYLCSHFYIAWMFILAFPSVHKILFIFLSISCWNIITLWTENRLLLDRCSKPCQKAASKKPVLSHYLYEKWDSKTLEKKTWSKLIVFLGLPWAPFPLSSMRRAILPSSNDLATLQRQQSEKCASHLGPLFFISRNNSFWFRAIIMTIQSSLFRSQQLSFAVSTAWVISPNQKRTLSPPEEYSGSCLK